jgi:hypothetical protein
MIDFMADFINNIVIAAAIWFGALSYINIRRMMKEKTDGGQEVKPVLAFIICVCYLIALWT